MGLFRKIIESFHRNGYSEYQPEEIRYINGYPDPFSQDFHKTAIGKMEAEHYRNSQKIETNYSILYQARTFHGSKADQLIALCKKDIELAPALKDFWGATGSVPPSYGTFKRLAILYERRKEYDEAISVCKQSLELGFLEGKPGQTQARIVKLLRLAGRTEELQTYLDDE